MRTDKLRRTYINPVESRDPILLFAYLVFGQFFAGIHAILNGIGSEVGSAKHCRRYMRQLGKRGVARYATLQLRIERDWQSYLTAKFGTTEVDDGCEFITVDPLVLARRVAASNVPVGCFFACCDEDDLPVANLDIKSTFHSVGLQLIFKSDVYNDFMHLGRIQKSIIGFESCLQSPMYIGLARSNFSEMVWLYDRISNRLEHSYSWSRPGACVVPV